MRLFFALWPDMATQHNWAASTEPLLKLLGGKRVPVSNLHLTLHFLGEIDGSQSAILHDVAEDAVQEAIDLRFDRLECWRKADLACLRAQENPSLTRLVQHLASGLQEAGLSLEKRAFKPHVTLARQLRHHEEHLPVWPVLEWRAQTLALVRSRLTPDGAIYAPVGEWTLT